MYGLLLACDGDMD